MPELTPPQPPTQEAPQSAVLGQLRAQQGQQQEGEGGGPTQEGTVDQLAGYMQQLEQLVGNIFKSIQVVAPQLKPLVVPIVQGGKALAQEVSQMKAGAQPQNATGRAPGASMPGSVIAA